LKIITTLVVGLMRMKHFFEAEIKGSLLTRMLLGNTGA